MKEVCQRQAVLSKRQEEVVFDKAAGSRWIWRWLVCLQLPGHHGSRLSMKHQMRSRDPADRPILFHVLTWNV